MLIISEEGRIVPDELAVLLIDTCVHLPEICEGGVIPNSFGSNVFPSELRYEPHNPFCTGGAKYFFTIGRL
jgi:hypothetical protein